LNPKLDIPQENLAEFCRRWMIEEFALFGSVLREDFTADSDVDVLVSFQAEAKWTLFDLASMREELKAIFGREVDLLTRGGLEASRNYLRREAILAGAEIIYAA